MRLCSRTANSSARVASTGTRAALQPELWYTRCPLPTATSIAIDHGFFSNEFSPDGIGILSLRAAADRSAREGHFDHNQSNLFRQGGNIPPIWSRAAGADTVVIGASWLAEFQAVVALPGAGLQKPADLAGKRLGVPRRVNDSIDYWRAMCLRGYLAALDAAGLTAADVTFVDLPVSERQIPTGTSSATGTLWNGATRARRQQQEAFALIRGACDAIYTAGAPGAELTAFLGAEIVADLGNDPALRHRINNQNPAVLTVSGELLRTRPTLVDRYLRALVHASAWAASHPDATRRTIANDVGAGEEWVDAAYGERISERLAIELDEPLIAAIDAQKQFLLENGFIARDFDVRTWIDPEPLRRAMTA